jgi:hypothetical protein
MASDFAMSKPAIVPERREIWYSDGATGFYVLRVADSAWPAAGRAATAHRSCLARPARLGRRGISGVRLGVKRRGLARRLRAPLPSRRRPHAPTSARRSARMIRAAASISARCENACGKFPRCRPVEASNSSA